MAKDLQYTLSLKDLFSKQMRGAVNETARLDSQVSKTQRMFDGLGSKIAGVFAIGGMASFGKQIFNSLDNYQQFSVALRTMMYGDALASKALEGQLISLAKTTPFELTEVQDATRKLMAYGVSGGEVVQTIRTLGDVSAGLGKETLPFIIRAFGQIKSKGHLAGQELNQLTEQGFNPLNIISKKTGESYDTLLKRMERGKITFSEVEQSFKDVTKEGGQFFNMMEEQSRTVGERWSNISDVWEQIKVNIGKSQTGILGMTMDFISKMANNINDKLSAGNFTDEALSSTGTKGAGFMSNLLGNFGYNTKGRALQGESYAANEMLGSSKTAKDILLNLKVLQVRKKEEDTLLKDALGSNDESIRSTAINEYNQKMSVFLETSKRLKGSLSLLKSKGNTTMQPVDENGKIQSLGKSSTSSGVNLTAQRPQSLVINIKE